MNIGSIVKINQPEIYKRLKCKYNYSFNKGKKRKEKLSESDVISLMGQKKAIYKRGKGGSIKQI